MTSTARPSIYDSESQHQRSGPQQDQDENWSDSASEKQAKQTKSSKRSSKLRQKLPEYYRQHTSESLSQFPDDSCTRQARNATVPYSYNYDPSHSPLYQPHPNPPMQYFTQPTSQAPAGYHGLYTYPGQGGYLSVPRTGNFFEQPSGPSPYGHPSREYSESDYGFGQYNYDQHVPPPPEYPIQDPLRTPLRPRTPNVQPQRSTNNMYRDEVERKPRKKRPRMPKKEKTLPKDKITNAEIMEALEKIQQEVKENAEIRADPERREYRQHRNSPPANQFLFDDTTSLDIERQKIRELKGIIRRLLEDRRNQDYQDSYAGTSRRSFADPRQNRIEMDYRESALMNPRDLQSLELRLDLIIKYLEMGNSPPPQQLPEIYSNRQDCRIPNGQGFHVSDPSMLGPNSPTLSQPALRRSEYYRPTGNQRQDAQASNQARLRQQPSRIPEADEVPEEYLEAYQDPRVPLGRSRHGISSNNGIGSQSRGRSQPSVGQRSEFRGLGKRIVPGDQQRVRPGRDPIVESEEEPESEGEPVRDRTRMPYHHRPRAPDPPAQSGWGKRVNFG